MDKEKLLVELGLRVKRIREEKGLSQTQLANSIGKDQPSVNRLEKGKINPSYVYLLEICDGLGVEINDLLKFDQKS
jgi:transcriptional regulator with XRE-family HTH domain